MKTKHWIVVGLLALAGACYVSRADYRAFDEQREAWHRRCDAYLDATGPQADDCAREMRELLAYAKRKGW